VCLEELTDRGKLGVRFALETAQGALLFEAKAFRGLAENLKSFPFLAIGDMLPKHLTVRGYQVPDNCA